ncbi:unnamed protein product, partial [Medioppia subpectinata]
MTVGGNTAVANRMANAGRRLSQHFPYAFSQCLAEVTNTSTEDTAHTLSIPFADTLTTMSAAIESSDRNNIHEERFQYTDQWTITTKKSHILQSKCVSPFICDKTKDTVNGLSSEAAVDLDRVCMCCRYEYLLSMPHMPDMTYANNWLIVDHKTGFSLRFNCLDALRVVSKELPRHLKVDAADDWMKSRADSQYTRFTAKPFDWTFTTDYKGSAVSVADGTDVATDGSAGVEFAPTDERINIERLKRKDDILFYDDVDLFEDELADHGVAKCSVKIRVMKQSFFILMRFFLRIDNVLVRMNDTRLYHEVGTDFILREYTNREAFVKDLHIPAPVLIDPVQLANH